MKQGIIYRATEGPFRYQAWPSVCQDENGVLYAVCSGHRSSHVCPFGKNLMFVSNDGGETWSVPQIVNDTWLDDRDAGITYLGNGKMLLSYFHHPIDVYSTIWRDWIVREADDCYKQMVEDAINAYSSFDAEKNTYGSFVKKSEDYGKTWGEAIKLPVSSPHGAVLTQDRRLLYLGKEFSGRTASYTNAEDNDAPFPPEERGHIFLYESFDEGLTWEKLSKVPMPDGCGPNNIHEPHVIMLPNGELIAALRAEGGEVYHGFTMYFSSSTDGGRTFSKPWSSQISGSPPHLLLLKDGGVLCSYGRREAPYGIRAVVSYDGCRSFGDEIILSEAVNGDLGYPATVQLADGSLVTVYYQRYKDDKRTSILYTKWEL